MPTRADFEADLKTIAELPVAVASERKLDALVQPSSETADNTSSALEVLRDATARLEKDNSLFSGDPDGVFTYEDPILAIAALWHRMGPEAEAYVGPAATPGSNLRNTSFLKWMLTGVRAWLARGDQAFVTLGGRTPTGPITLNQQTVRVAVVGDAGYKGQAQANVIRSIRNRHQERPFDLVIHLGDTYFAGSAAEMLTNFLAPFSTIGARVLTLCGNHDLYYGPDGYSSALQVLNQPGRYFAVETPHWRLVCLDTALGSERILRNDGLLDEGQLEWLEGLINTKDDRPIILLSHHYIISAWESPAQSLSDQLRDLIKGKIFAWYWGHEHGCATYDIERIGFYGACIGNGAFLEKWAEPHHEPFPSWYANGKCNCFGAEGHFWPHGYLELELTQNQILENYYVEGLQPHSRTLRF